MDTRNMKTRAALLLCGAALAVTPMLAQSDTPATPPAQSEGAPPPPPPGGGPRGGDPARRMAMLQHDLNLSSDQTAQIKSIFEAERTKMEALRSNTSLAPEDRRTQMMAMRQEESTKIKAVLTPDQVTKYDAMEARMRQRPSGPGGDGPPPPPPPPSNPQ